MGLVVLVPLVAVCELVWARSATLGAHRAHFRALLAIFSLSVIAIYFGSVLGLIPSELQYGRGVLRFASDAQNYQAYAERIATSLRQGRLGVLFDPSEFLYSRVLGAVYALFGSSPLGGMLFNGFFYLTSLVSIYLIGRSLFGAQVALTATWIVALWPTFLLHETQTLKWDFTTAGFHLTMAGLTLSLCGAPFLSSAIACILGFFPVIADLPYTARLLYVTIGVTALLLAALSRMARPRLVQAAKLGIVGLVLFSAYSMTWASSPLTVPETYVSPSEIYARERARDHALLAPASSASGAAAAPTASSDLLTEIQAAMSAGMQAATTAVSEVSAGLRTWVTDSIRLPIEDALDHRVWHVIRMRQRALEDEYVVAAATTIPGARNLTGSVDLLLFLPTAYRIALFSPTPWILVGGQQGVSGGRAFALPEMLAYYVLLPFIAIAFSMTIWPISRPTAPAALLLFMFLLGIYALEGLVIVNAGTLLRLRLPYLLIQIPFGVAGVRAAVHVWQTQRRGASLTWV